MRNVLIKSVLKPGTEIVDGEARDSPSVTTKFK
jgi:hypothetical protein